MAALVDPVCGMELQPGQVGAQTQHQGKGYSFCSEECRRLFEQNPEEYVGMIADDPQSTPPIPR